LGKEDTRGLVFAGGAVVATLTDGDSGDIDIFLCCAPEEATTFLKKVLSAVQRLHRRENGDTAKEYVDVATAPIKHKVFVFERGGYSFVSYYCGD
jgi:tRNA nucleotidyltransferase/poly(A) polymerase